MLFKYPIYNINCSYFCLLTKCIRRSIRNTDSGFSCSLFYRFRLFMFLVLQIAAFHVPGFTDSGFSCSWFYRLRLFHVPGFTDCGFSCSWFYRLRLFHVPGFLVPCSVPRSVPRFSVPVLQIAAHETLVLALISSSCCVRNSRSFKKSTQICPSCSSMYRLIVSIFY